MVKLFEIILLQRLSPLFEEIGFPDISQTAYPSMLHKKLFSLKLEKVEISTSVFMTLRKLLTPLSYPC